MCINTYKSIQNNVEQMLCTIVQYYDIYETLEILQKNTTYFIDIDSKGITNTHGDDKFRVGAVASRIR